MDRQWLIAIGLWSVYTNRYFPTAESWREKTVFKPLTSQEVILHIHLGPQAIT